MVDNTDKMARNTKAMAAIKFTDNGIVVQINIIITK